MWQLSIGLEEKVLERIFVIFDDTVSKSEVIQEVIGKKGFADVVVKKKRLEDYYHQVIESTFSRITWYLVRSTFAFQELLKKFVECENEVRVLHCFGNYFITDTEKAKLTLEKLMYIDENYRVLDDDKNLVGVMFNTLGEYIRYLKRSLDAEDSKHAARYIEQSISMSGIVDIGIPNNFIQCITGSFDARYFNSLSGNEYTIVKKSSNKEKIKAEYMYYHLLPDDMKCWFVMPFDYKEDANTGQYTMQRLHMSDLAIKYVHGSFDEAEFSSLLDMYFHFFSERHKKAVSKIEYERIADKLYLTKVEDRIDALKTRQEYMKIKNSLNNSCAWGGDINALKDKYCDLKMTVEARVKYPLYSVIGHGDPCFANALYSKAAMMLKFIDPKGAQTEDELWTNPYYDVAKLSHSICGRYDFFNNDLYDIELDRNFQLKLNIDFDNSTYKTIFKQKLERNGFDYLSVRLYEASLFLSMLPLHIDNPHKVLGFILNARDILEEIENEIR